MDHFEGYVGDREMNEVKAVGKGWKSTTQKKTRDEATSGYLSKERKRTQKVVKFVG